MFLCTPNVKYKSKSEINANCYFGHRLRVIDEITY